MSDVLFMQQRQIYADLDSHSQLVTALVIDVDNGTPTSFYQDKLAPYAYAIHSSYSHTAEHSKFRVVLFLSAPVASSVWTDNWVRLSLFLEGNIDQSTKDASRIYYLPSHPDNIEPFSEFHEGELFCIEALPPLPPEPMTGTKTPAMVSSELTNYIAPPGMYAQEGIAFVADRCHLIRECARPENQNKVSEPLWRTMLSNLSRLSDGREFAHKASASHDGYDPEVTDNYLARHFTEAGPLTCQYARDHGWSGCPLGNNCLMPNSQPVTSPIQLANWSTINMKKASQTVLAQSFIDRYYRYGLVYTQENYWGYRNGAYQILSQRSQIDKPIVHILNMGATKTLLKSVDEILKSIVSVDPDAFTRNKHLLCLCNGTLDLESGNLLDHSPDHMLQNKVDINYDPTDECPSFLSFLDSVFQPDADKTEKIALLRQWMGYLMIPDTSYQKMVWLVGAGGNGKSVLIQIVEWLVGRANISHAMLDRMERPVVRAELVGKTLNISPDLPKDAMINDGYIKAIVAGDTIEAEQKYKPSFSFKPHVRLMAAMNNLPRTNDTSDGFYRRVLILTFNRKYAEHEQNPGLADELHTELPGILNWALSGLAELKAQGGFTIPPSSTMALATYRTESNPVQMFAEECLLAADSGGYVAKDLYTVYSDWAKARGFKNQALPTFGRALASLGFEKRKSSGREFWKVSLTGEGKEARHQIMDGCDLTSTVSTPESTTATSMGYSL